MRRAFTLVTTNWFLLAAVAAPVSATPPEALARVRAAEAARVVAFDRAAASVVCIFADASTEGGGSGVLIAPDGYGLTNFHVVAEMLGERKGVGGLVDGRLYPLRVLGIDPGGDLAMFKLDGPNPFVPAPLGDAATLRVGQWVAAMGNPFLVAEDYAPTITVGVISGLHRYQAGQGALGSLLEYADCIQVSTSINPGNSGGPLFDLAGRVIGINGRASFEERGRVNVGLGYAITINQARRFIPGLRAGRLCEHGTLSATVRTAGKDLIVSELLEPGAAQRAGVQLGDVLLAVNGRPVRTPNEFNNAIAPLPANWPVALTLRRKEQELKLSARLDRLPAKLESPYLLDFAHNHAEVRGHLARWRTRAAELSFTGAVEWRLHREPSGDAGATPILLRVEPAGGAGYVREGQSRPLGIPDPKRLDAPLAADDWSSPAVWDEWWQIAQPLDPSTVGFGWELLDGDEVDGRIVAVVERRFDNELRVRWKFSVDTDRLEQATLGTEDRPELIVWTPRYAVGPNESAIRWERRAANGEVIRFKLSSGPGAEPAP